MPIPMLYLWQSIHTVNDEVQTVAIINAVEDRKCSSHGGRLSGLDMAIFEMLFVKKVKVGCEMSRGNAKWNVLSVLNGESQLKSS